MRSKQYLSAVYPLTCVACSEWGAYLTDFDRSSTFRFSGSDPDGLKSGSVRPCPDTCRHAKFHPNPSTRFWVILLTDRQTDKYRRQSHIPPPLSEVSITSVRHYYRLNAIYHTVTVRVSRSAALTDLIVTRAVSAPAELLVKISRKSTRRTRVENDASARPQNLSSASCDLDVCSFASDFLWDRICTYLPKFVG